MRGSQGSRTPPRPLPQGPGAGQQSLPVSSGVRPRRSSSGLPCFPRPVLRCGQAPSCSPPASGASPERTSLPRHPSVPREGLSLALILTLAAHAGVHSLMSQGNHGSGWDRGDGRRLWPWAEVTWEPMTGDQGQNCHFSARRAAAVTWACIPQPLGAMPVGRGERVPVTSLHTEGAGHRGLPSCGHTASFLLEGPSPELRTAGRSLRCLARGRRSRSCSRVPRQLRWKRGGRFGYTARGLPTWYTRVRVWSEVPVGAPLWVGQAALA